MSPISGFNFKFSLRYLIVNFSWLILIFLTNKIFGLSLNVIIKGSGSNSIDPSSSMDTLSLLDFVSFSNSLLFVRLFLFSLKNLIIPLIFSSFFKEAIFLILYFFAKSFNSLTFKVCKYLKSDIFK